MFAEISLTIPQIGYGIGGLAGIYILYRFSKILFFFTKMIEKIPIKSVGFGTMIISSVAGPFGAYEFWGTHPGLAVGMALASTLLLTFSLTAVLRRGGEIGLDISQEDVAEITQQFHQLFESLEMTESRIDGTAGEYNRRARTAAAKIREKVTEVLPSRK